MDFNTLGLNAQITDALAAQGITAPTAIQALAIPKILEHKDVVIHSETGSGKTLAYLLPLYAVQQPLQAGMQLLILVPTQELAMQVHRQVGLLSQNSGIALESITLFGDVNIKGQIEKLRAKPQIIIGTCGRLLELIQKKKITAHTIKTIVVDEADKLLDKQNIDGVRAIRKAVMRDTQVIFASASISAKTLEQAATLSVTPEVLHTGDTSAIPENIQHYYITVPAWRDKLEMLRKLIGAVKPQRALVFLNKPEETEVAATKLNFHEISCAFIHGTSAKQQRQKAIEDFSGGRARILIATDLAARGLHIENVSAVFSMSIPEDSTDYLHRAGRTGRGDNAGLSILIITERELPLVKKFQRVFSVEIPEISLHEGRIALKHTHPKTK